MWIAPRLRKAASPEADPPKPEPVPLASFGRNDGREMKLTLDSYLGRPFISLASWQDGRPEKGRMLSVRVSEIPRVIDALQRAAALAADWPGQDAPQRPEAAPQVPTDRRPPRRPTGADRAPVKVYGQDAPPVDSRLLDECEGDN